MRARILPFAAALALTAASALHAQAPGARLIPVLRRDDGAQVSLDSASVSRSGDSIFVARTVTVFTSPVALSATDTADRAYVTETVECPSLRTRRIAATLYRGDRQVRADATPHVLQVDSAVGTVRALCGVLLRSFARLPLEREVEDVDTEAHLVNGDGVSRALLSAGRPVLRRLHMVEGQAMLRFRVGADGRVDPASVQVLAYTLPDFGAVAARVAALMRFDPARAGGVPVPVWMNVPVDFTMGG